MNVGHGHPGARFRHRANQDVSHHQSSFGREEIEAGVFNHRGIIQTRAPRFGIQIDFEVVEWNTLINIWRAGAKHESSRGATGMNYSYFIQDPFTGFIRHLQCNLQPPAGTNWGHYCTPEMDALFDKVRNTFDAAEQTRVLQAVHEKFVDDALFLMVTHDVNPRAMSPKVKGFVQAQNWFQDFSPISMDK